MQPFNVQNFNHNQSREAQNAVSVIQGLELFRTVTMGLKVSFSSNPFRERSTTGLRWTQLSWSQWYIEKIFTHSHFSRKRHFVCSSCPVGNENKKLLLVTMFLRRIQFARIGGLKETFHWMLTGLPGHEPPVLSPPPHVLVHDIVYIRLINSVNRFVDLELGLFLISKQNVTFGFTGR